MNSTARSPGFSGKSLLGIFVLAVVLGGTPLLAMGVRDAGAAIARVISTSEPASPPVAAGACHRSTMCASNALFLPGGMTLPSWCTLDKNGIRNCRI